MRDLKDLCAHLVTDRRLSRGRSTIEVVQAAVEGGVDVVQLREKDLSTLDFYREALALKEFLRRRDVVFIINDRVDMAMALDAHGVHLGQTDMPVNVARKLLGEDKIIGLSVEEPGHALKEDAQYADYLGVSPIFVTSTKPELQRGWGLEGLRALRSITEKPLVAIGSIKIENAAAVIEAGADSVAVVSCITYAQDPKTAAMDLVAEVKRGKSQRIM